MSNAPPGVPSDSLANRPAGDPTPPRPRPAGRFRLAWLGWVLAALIAVAFVWLQRGEWDAITVAAREARRRYLVLAGLLQAGWLVVFGASFWAALRAVGVRLPFGRSLALAWSCNFVNMVVKTGGIGGMALFIRAGARRGYPGSRVALGYLIEIFVGYAAFLVLLALALMLLWLGGEIRRLEVIAAAGTFLVITLALGGLLALLSVPARIERVHRRVAGLLNRVARRFGRGPLLDAEGGSRLAAEASEVLALVRARPVALLPVLALNAAWEVISVGVMFAVLLAFDAAPSLRLAVIAYTLTILFSYVSIVPSGLGLVEVSLTALLLRWDVGAGAAALTAVVYRLYEFWTPFLVGALATRFAGTAPIPAVASAPSSPGAAEEG